MAGLYIHIPFCRQKCAYCDFPSFPGREHAAGRYFSALLREAELWKEQRGGMGDFNTVFIGGGTPSLLPAGELERLMDGLGAVFAIRPIEFTVEANPGTVDREKLESFRRMGAGRLSFGVQAAQDGLLGRIGRIHTWEDFYRSFNLAREAGFMNINADMMTGLPGQTTEQAVETARKLMKLGVEHVSCYGLILEEGTALNAAVEAGAEAVPDEDSEREMFHAVREVLEDGGLKRYEISNFARPGLECLHNLNYWRGGNWLGLGLGAASHFSGWRRENHCDLDEYMAALEQDRLPPADEHDIGADEAAFESIMLELRLVDGIDFERFEARHGFGFMERYTAQAGKLLAAGLIRQTPSGVALTERGMDLQNTVLMEFME